MFLLMNGGSSASLLFVGGFVDDGVISLHWLTKAIGAVGFEGRCSAAHGWHALYTAVYQHWQAGRTQD